MDNGIALIAIVVVAVVAGAIVWLALRRNLPPDAALALAAYVAAIRAQLSGIVDEAMVTEIAGAVWDRWADGAKYFSRDEFVSYVLRALKMDAQAQQVLSHLDISSFASRPMRLHISNQQLPE
jgi:hypothetical protein